MSAVIPLEQFGKWLQESIDEEAEEPTAMTVATVSPEGRPASRVVLLKGIDQDKLIFYTNYNSRKGQHLNHTPYASATFFWPKLERQVHFEGKVEKVPPEVSDAYFDSRPRKSRIGACVSPQSQVINSRTEIMAGFLKIASRYLGKKVPRPSFWGGYAIIPDRIEFWQGRPSRLHDRILYTQQNDHQWKIERLAP